MSLTCVFCEKPARFILSESPVCRNCYYSDNRCSLCNKLECECKLCIICGEHTNIEGHYSKDSFYDIERKRFKHIPVKCQECSSVSPTYLNAWNYTPEPLYFYTSPKPFRSPILHHVPAPNETYFGLELELSAEYSYDVLLILLSQEDWPHKLFYVKSDSSCHPGFEICSYPLSFFAWKTREVQSLFGILDTLDISFGVSQNAYKKIETNQKRKLIGKETIFADSCAGIHVHVSKIDSSGNKLYSKSRGLLAYEFISKLPKSLYELWFGRGPTDFSRVEPCILLNAFKSYLSVHDDNLTYVGGTDSSDNLIDDFREYVNRMEYNNMFPEVFDKYNAVNLRHADTIEFRSFSSSINYKKVLSNLILVEAIMEYCSDDVFYDYLLHEFDLTDVGRFRHWIKYSKDTYGDRYLPLLSIVPTH